MFDKGTVFLGRLIFARAHLPVAKPRVAGHARCVFLPSAHGTWGLLLFATGLNRPVSGRRKQQLCIKKCARWEGSEAPGQREGAKEKEDLMPP